MTGKPPSIQEWKELYNAAIKFKELGCWNWMGDSDIFGVQNPVTGEIGYCCVMGRLGEHFALAVYLGTEGLEGYLKIKSGVSPSSCDALHLQKCLMASFEDREFLTREDLQIIKTLGLKFRGRNSWPLFRSYLPGYHPWYLCSEEARYLTMALQQAINVCLRFKDNPEMLTLTTDNQYLVRVPEWEEGSLRWRDEWLEPLKSENEEIDSEPLDENRMESIRRMVPQQPRVWEIDSFYSPDPVRDKEERPYYPHVILWLDHYSGLILNFHLAKPAEYRSEFVEQFLEFAENNFLPRELLTKKGETYELLEPITSSLGIKLRRVDKLPTLEDARDSMFEYLRGK